MHLVHSGPVVTHRSASGAQPAGQQVCANAGGISAYAKTRITSLRYPMPFPSLTPIWGRKLVSRQADPIRSGRRNRRAQDKRPDHCPAAAARSRGIDRTWAFLKLQRTAGIGRDRRPCCTPGQLGLLLSECDGVQLKKARLGCGAYGVKENLMQPSALFAGTGRAAAGELGHWRH